MPLYEYRCPCGQTQEHQVWVADEAPSLVACPCGREAARVVSPCSFRFKQFRFEPPPMMAKGATQADIWGSDHPLADGDGINPLTYKSEKLFVDGGKNG